MPQLLWAAAEVLLVPNVDGISLPPFDGGRDRITADRMFDDGVQVAGLKAIATDGLKIINIQMMGLLVGGIFWGVLGDKKGRLNVLYASIILYSLGNIANGFVHTVNQYATVRFITGFGLAGELGAGITLVSELLSKEKRGIGTSFVAGIGLMGAVFAFLIKQYFVDWRICYFIGGGLGFILLFLRVFFPVRKEFFQSGVGQRVLG